MRTQLLLLTLSCFLLLVAMGHATPPWIGSAMQWKTPDTQQSIKLQAKTAIRASWDGRAVQFWDSNAVSDADARAALGISDVQYQKIKDRLSNADMNEYQQNYPDVQKTIGELEAMRKPDDPFFENMQNSDEATKIKFLDISERLSKLMWYSRVDFRNEIVLATLTEDQKQKLNEAVLASISAMPVISPNVFEALGLTDDQKQKMAAVKGEQESDFEKVLEKVASGHIAMLNIMLAEFEQQGGDITSGETLLTQMPEITKKLQAENPEYQKILEEIKSQGRAFAVLYKTKLFDVLTDGQWKRLQELTDNPPEHIKVIRKKLWENMGWSEETETERFRDDIWNPGVAIPEAYRQVRNARGSFP